MAKGAANQEALGSLHKTLTNVFIKVLARYENQLDEELNQDKLEEDVVDELIDSGVTINPAMLTAVSKFLKDNDIMFDTEELEELGSLERRLKDKQKRRDNVVSLNNIPQVG